MMRSSAVSSRFAVVIQLCVVELLPAMLHDFTEVVRSVVRHQVLNEIFVLRLPLLGSLRDLLASSLIPCSSSAISLVNVSAES